MSNTSSLCSFIGGVLAGGVLGLLFAPEKGSDMRKKIKKCVSRKCACCVDDPVDEIKERFTAEFDN